MSSNPYSSYGGNPYAPTDNTQTQPQAQAQTSHNPYAPGGGYGQSNPYGSPTHNTTVAGTPYQQQPAAPDTTLPQPGSQPLSNSDFLARVESAKTSILTLTSQISTIASLHQRSLSSTSASSSALEAQTAETQVLTTSIRDQIKFLETDAARSGESNKLKSAQVGQLKSSFKRQLEEFRSAEVDYERKYREQIARQYRIVNPEASEEEVREAADANWGDEGVFQTALKSNRTATATTVLSAVRQRHADIQTIEQTLVQLNQLFEDLASAVVLQEPAVQAAEQRTDEVKRDTEAGNVQLGKGIEHARRARKLKWWCLLIVVLILIAVGLIVGLVVGLNKNK
ncbi:t-SNARE [Myriangium duriaei CBS 260.36]|uniref:t-SNARE n=1 Tax=Myriangium duriaei CBS 260.36 TaxID=1168546 RepID=A0A9P4J577_9PEZI|nr:t-SNARE [Myriangium duriaei CBS 260.36]